MVTHEAPEHDPSFLAFRHRVFTESVDIVEFATVPIAFLKDGNLTLDRTGVLLAIGDDHFLITAEHDLEEIYRQGFAPMLIPASPHGQLIPMVDDRMVVSHNPSVDLAVFRLNPAVVQLLNVEYRPLRLTDVRLHAPTAAEGPLFLVTGFPKANEGRDSNGRNRIDVCRYMTVRFEGDYAQVEDFIPASHIVLEYNRESDHTSGYRGPPPAAPGLSGCGIWYLPTPRGIKSWQPQDIKLVGIQTAWLRNRFLKGTIIHHALTMIWYRFSDARNAIRLHGIEF